MNKLKNKVFLTIFSILTISVISFIVIYNVQNYIDEKTLIQNSLDQAAYISINTDKEPENKNSNDENIAKEKPMEDSSIENDNVKFIDSTIYTVLIDKDNNIIDIINRSNNNLTNNQINEIALDILENNNLKYKYIGCLYFEDYSYVYLNRSLLIIFDNSDVKKSLIFSLEISILLFIIFEIIIIFICKLITNWITKPVKISFDKQKQFITDASHELKTPLSVIIASGEALEDYPNEKKWLKNIINEAERMNLLITDLLELSMSEREDDKDYEIGDLSKLVELSILTFESVAFEKNIKLKYDIKENIKMKMNENNIKQLIEILLDNAIKHSKENETINIILKKDNNIELLVKNKGDAIPKGEEEKIFERFYRIDKSRNRKENRYGLGLAIAKNIVEKHNGKISAYSSNNITTFKVLFKK